MWTLAVALALVVAPSQPAPTPPAPVPPAARPPPRLPTSAGPFIIFFDRDSADITDQAAAILENVVVAWRSSDSFLIVLAGHSDRAGTAGANLALSQLRADNVKSYLAGRGVPEAVMSSVGYGEQNFLVETSDGSREPQNRNVQIFFKPRDHP